MKTSSSDQNIAYTGQVGTRMAWSFGSRSPVMCTVLGDEPLFVIEEAPDDADLIDELMLALELEAALMEIPEAAEEINRTRKARTDEINRIERVGHHMDTLKPMPVEQAFDLFSAALNNTVKNKPPFDPKSYIEKSLTLKAMYQNALAHSIELKETPVIADAAYDRMARAIHYNSQTDSIAGQFAFIRALRQAELHVNGCYIDPLHFQPEDAVLINRIYELDLLIHEMVVAWEMNVGGDRELWLHLLGTGNYDLAIAFAREAMTDFRTIQTGKALHQTIEAWFFSGRCRQLDQALIRDLLARDSACDFIADNEMKILGRELICRIGERSNGENYLRQYVDDFMNNPLFSDVRDRSSANFMWFLKFERQFREHEEALMSNKVQLAEIIRFPNADIIDINNTEQRQ